MRIGCVQFAPQVGDTNNNLNRADALLNRGNPEGLDLLVLPELAFSGYNFKSLRDITPFLEPSCSGITSLWARTTALKYDCTVIAGYPEKVDVTDKWPTGPEYYNAALVVNKDGDTVGNYRKRHLYYTDESWALEGNDSFYRAYLPGLGRTAIGICMDLNPYKFEAPWDDFEFANHVLESGASLAVVSMAWNTFDHVGEFTGLSMEPHMETLKYWVSRFEPLIKANTDKEVIIVFANRSGIEDDALYVGTSAVIGIQAGEVNVYGVLDRGAKELLVVDTTKEPWAKLVPTMEEKGMSFRLERREETAPSPTDNQRGPFSSNFNQTAASNPPANQLQNLPANSVTYTTSSRRANLPAPKLCIPETNAEFDEDLLTAVQGNIPSPTPIATRSRTLFPDPSPASTRFSDSRQSSPRSIATSEAPSVRRGLKPRRMYSSRASASGRSSKQITPISDAGTFLSDTGTLMSESAQSDLSWMPTGETRWNPVPADDSSWSAQDQDDTYPNDDNESVMSFHTDLSIASGVAGDRLDDRSWLAEMQARRRDWESASVESSHANQPDQQAEPTASGLGRKPSAVGVTAKLEALVGGEVATENGRQDTPSRPGSTKVRNLSRNRQLATPLGLLWDDNPLDAIPIVASPSIWDKKAPTQSSTLAGFQSMDAPQMSIIIQRPRSASTGRHGIAYSGRSQAGSEADGYESEDEQVRGRERVAAWFAKEGAHRQSPLYAPPVALSAPPAQHQHVHTGPIDLSQFRYIEEIPCATCPVHSNRNTPDVQATVTTSGGTTPARQLETAPATPSKLRNNHLQEDKHSSSAANKPKTPRTPSGGVYAQGLGRNIPDFSASVETLATTASASERSLSPTNRRGASSDLSLEPVTPKAMVLVFDEEEIRIPGAATELLVEMKEIPRYREKTAVEVGLHIRRPRSVS